MRPSHTSEVAFRHCFVCCAQALREGSLAGRVLSRLAVLVLDEADLLLSYGHEADLQAVAPQVRAPVSRFGFGCRPATARTCRPSHPRCPPHLNRGMHNLVS